jgi:uncharacterized membrane protein YphA (DoxX/SURF4 family)
MHQWGIPVLRVALGVVFLWFGLLKIFGVSPMAKLIETSYSFLPEPLFIIFLGIWEAVIGLGLIFKIKLRLTIALLWLQMAGIFVAPILSPSMFFVHGNFLILTSDGEFVIKNLVLVASSIVIGGHEITD